MITQAQIDHLADGQQIEAQGLRARRRGGTVTYDYRYRLPGGPQQQKALRPVGISLKQAIAEANKLRGAVAAGNDVASQAREQAARVAATLDVVLDAWIVAKGSEYRSLPNIISTLKNHIRPQFGATSVYDLQSDKLFDHFAALSERIPETARQARKYLSWALRWYRAKDSNYRKLASPIPDAGEVLAEANKRTRVLSTDEIRDVWHAAVEVNGTYGALVRLLLLTGCRRSEIAELQADEITHDDRRGHHILIPAARMKANKEHAVPLLPAIRALLPQGQGELLSIQHFANCKMRLDSAIARRREVEGRAPMPAWVLHDLRRTVRTRLSVLGVRDDVAEAILAHVRPGIVGVYDQYDRWEERCADLARWAAHLEQIVAGASGANVVALKAPALAS
jgi:integrase